jgi:hypothetical protein
MEIDAIHVIISSADHDIGLAIKGFFLHFLSISLFLVTFDRPFKMEMLNNVLFPLIGIINMLPVLLPHIFSCHTGKNCISAG